VNPHFETVFVATPRHPAREPRNAPLKNEDAA